MSEYVHVSFSLPFLGVFQDTIDDNLSHTEPVIQVTFTPCQSTVELLLPTNINSVLLNILGRSCSSPRCFMPAVLRQRRRWSY